MGDVRPLWVLTERVKESVNCGLLNRDPTSDATLVTRRLN
jgi:hypothetical protein